MMQKSGSKKSNKKEQFDKYTTLNPVQWSSPPKESKVLTTTWAMKKKSNGTLRKA
jgi:hypothetical protein